MNIAIVGTGYVGLVSGTCFAETGANVVCVDTDAEKIGALKRGEIPIYEPGLEEMVARNVKAGRLKFTTSLESCLDDVSIVFSAVGTPPNEDGSADLQYVLEVARTIGKHINRYVLVVTKSTVPVGTAKKVKAVIEEELRKRELEARIEELQRKLGEPIQTEEQRQYKTLEDLLREMAKRELHDRDWPDYDPLAWWKHRVIC